MIINQKITKMQVDEIISLSNEGSHTRKEIATAVGCSKNTVYRYQKMNDIL